MLREPSTRLRDRQPSEPLTSDARHDGHDRVRDLVHVRDRGGHHHLVLRRARGGGTHRQLGARRLQPAGALPGASQPKHPGASGCRSADRVVKTTEREGGAREWRVVPCAPARRSRRKPGRGLTWTFFSVATTTQSSPRIPTVVSVLVFTRLKAYSALRRGGRGGGRAAAQRRGDLFRDANPPQREVAPLPRRAARRLTQLVEAALGAEHRQVPVVSGLAGHGNL